MSDEPMSVDELLAQGCCCGSGCENCPYDPQHEAGNTTINQRWVDYKRANPAKTYQEWQASIIS